MKKNDQTFCLSYGTPLLYGSSLHQELDLFSTSEAASQILSGAYTYKEDVDTKTIKLLHEFTKVFQHTKNVSFNQHIIAQDYTTY